MKTIIVMAIGLLSFTSVMATPVDQCIAEHLETAAKEPKMNYETDEGVLKIWCQCKLEQGKLGKREYEILKFCYADTDDAINKHLKMGPYSK